MLVGCQLEAIHAFDIPLASASQSSISARALYKVSETAHTACGLGFTTRLLQLPRQKQCTLCGGSSPGRRSLLLDMPDTPNARNSASSAASILGVSPASPCCWRGWEARDIFNPVSGATWAECHTGDKVSLLQLAATWEQRPSLFHSSTSIPALPPSLKTQEGPLCFTQQHGFEESESEAFSYSLLK